MAPASAAPTGSQTQIIFHPRGPPVRSPSRELYLAKRRVRWCLSPRPAPIALSASAGLRSVLAVRSLRYVARPAGNVQQGQFPAGAAHAVEPTCKEVVGWGSANCSYKKKIKKTDMGLFQQSCSSSPHVLREQPGRRRASAAYLGHVDGHRADHATAVGRILGGQFEAG